MPTSSNVSAHQQEAFYCGCPSSFHFALSLWLRFHQLCVRTMLLFALSGSGCGYALFVTRGVVCVCRCGDRLLAVDGHSLESVKHATAVKMLKQTGTRVTLEVVSWLGTEL
jgi:PDZ domain